MKAKQLKPGVYWVGAIDWNVRDFHGYGTPNGTTYNAYLVVDEKIVLVDTVKKGFSSEMLARIADVIDPAKIDVIVTNHVEMDHSGSLPDVLKVAPHAQILVSPTGETGLKAHFHQDWNLKVVRTGETFSLGKRNLTFVQVPFVHWPDSMVTYIPEEKILLPNDAFGQHYTSPSLFDDENPYCIIEREAAKYYANIVLPFGNQVGKALDALQGLEIDMIAPSHGVIWRKYLKEIKENYVRWSTQVNREEAVVVYDTMWGSTESMARTILAAFDSQGIPARLRSLKHSANSDIMTDVLSARYIALGSPILNAELFPSVAGFFTYMKGLKPIRKVGMVFGSCGWNAGALQAIESGLKPLEWQFPVPVQSLRWVPTQLQLDNVVEAMKPIFALR